MACPPLPTELSLCREMPLSFRKVHVLKESGKGAPLTNSRARFITAVDEQGLGPPDGLPTGGAAVEGLWEGRTPRRDGLCPGSHAWAKLTQDAPGQERWGHSNVTVMVGTKVPCP